LIVFGDLERVLFEFAGVTVNEQILRHAF
jgi:hypothetical protein